MTKRALGPLVVRRSGRPALELRRTAPGEIAGLHKASSGVENLLLDQILPREAAHAALGDLKLSEHLVVLLANDMRG